MNRKFLKAIIFILALGFSSSSESAPIADFPPEFEQYNALLKQIEKSKQKQPLQGFFYIAKKLEQADTQALPANKIIVLKKTKGLLLLDMPEPYAPRLVIDPNFLVTLAKHKGTEEDIKFFETYGKFTDTNWEDFAHPYLGCNQKSGGDGCVCVNTSSPYLYDYYAGWLKYLGGYPSTDYLGTLDIYQNFVVEQFGLYELYLQKFDFCEDKELAQKNISEFIEKVKNNQNDSNMEFSKRIIKAIKLAR